MSTAILEIVLSTGITSAVLQVLLDRLATFIETKATQFIELQEEFLKFRATLAKAKSLVDDVENKRSIPEFCRSLLEDVKSVVLDAEDLLNEIDIQLEQRSSCDSIGNQVFPRSRLVLSYSTLNVPTVLNKIHNKLGGLSERLENYCLMNSGQPQLAIPDISSSSLVDESSIIGRSAEKKEIIQMLLSRQTDGGEKNVSVIPIVAMGGIGKTALAQLVYNDPGVVTNFDFRIWVSVPLNYDVGMITKSIFNSVKEQVSWWSKLKEAFDFHPKDNSQWDLDTIQIQLQKKLRGKKFLLVLDDMWNENPGDWDRLKLPFQVAAQGSKILLTTRSKIVSAILSGTPAYHLHSLGSYNCWEIIKKTACRSDADENEVIGLEMAEKCKRLPLAAKVIGHVLRKYTDMNWDVLSKFEFWESPEHGNHLYPVLKLSYDNLAFHLRRCFTYCSIFPRDHKFEKDDLVQLWAAEDFIQPQGKQEIEEIGRQYFDGLCSRSLLQVSKDGQPRYVMHHLIHDMARLVSINLTFCLEDNMSALISIPRNVRYLSLLCQDINASTLQKFYGYEKLRTFMLLSQYASNLKEVPHDFFLKLRLLRVLNLSQSGISDLHSNVQYLTHLHYLNLSHTFIKKLPTSIANLYGLETLKLKNCSLLVELPVNLRNLIKLRHLDFDGHRQISSMPIEVGNLTCLETLHAFIVGKDKGHRIEELKNLRCLRGSICITHLQNVDNPTESGAAMLHEKQYLDKLKLEWNEVRAQNVDQEVLTSLRPHFGLKKLGITGYCGSMFPNWIADSSVCNLEMIELSDCPFCTLLPSLGQLWALKSLIINNMSALENVDQLFCGSLSTFPSLEKLTFKYMPKWKYWSEIYETDMPRLKELSILSCEELVSLPSVHYLKSLEMLEIRDCPQLESLPSEGLPLSLTYLMISNSNSLTERCRVRGADWNKIRMIDTVLIDGELVSTQGRDN